MRFVLSTAAAVACALAAPALAQDGPPPPEASPFTGAHVELLGGLDNVRSQGEGETGLLYGVAGGFDWQAGQAVIGLEAEASGATTKQTVRDFLAAGDRLRLRAGRDLYVGARAGVVAGGSTLIYAKAGYTNARERLTYDDGTAANTLGFRVGENLDGVRAGAGAEFTAGRFLIKAEYRYSNYEADVVRHQGVVGVGVRF
jgi:outer membrane immunogenic protein